MVSFLKIKNVNEVLELKDNIKVYEVGHQLSAFDFTVTKLMAISARVNTACSVLENIHKTITAC